MRRRCTYYEGNYLPPSFTTSSQIKRRTEAHVCVYIRHKSLLWSTFVESNEITQLTQWLFYSLILPCSILSRTGGGPGHEAWGWVPYPLAPPPRPRICPESLRITPPCPRWSSWHWTLDTLVWKFCTDTAHHPQHNSRALKYSYSLCNLSSKSSKCLYWLRYSLLCQGSAGSGGVFHESVATVASQAVHVSIMGNLERYCWVSDYCSSAFTIICPEISRPDHSHISKNRLANQATKSKSMKFKSEKKKGSIDNNSSLRST